MKGILAAVLACAALPTAPVGAHHSHGNYVSTFMDIEGVVKQVHLLNPHSWVYLEVKNASGQPQTWALEATNVIGLQRIGVTREGGELIFRVSDTGIGIGPDELQHIFAEFRQVDATVTREYGGTGLGLSISKKFIEMHGGHIGVESKAGEGSTFFFSVPLRVGEPSPWTSEPSSP